MLKHVARAVLSALALTAGTLAATAQSHIALVIDNGKSHPPTQSGVDNRTASAHVVEQLKRMHYTVIDGRRTKLAELRQMLDRFKAGAASADVALLYFAGPTLNVGGSNHLLAADARADAALDKVGVPLDEITAGMTAKKANVVLLDSGFWDPLHDGLTRVGAGRSAAVAPIARRDKFFIASANMPGHVARGETDSHFSKMLALQLAQDMPSWDALGAKLRNEVFQQSRGSQIMLLNASVPASVRIAALPPAIAGQPFTPGGRKLTIVERAAFVKELQTELKRLNCHSAAPNGDAAVATNALKHLGISTQGLPADQQPPVIEPATATANEFEGYVHWARSIPRPICQPAVIAAPVVIAPVLKPQAFKPPVAAARPPVRQAVITPPPARSEPPPVRKAVVTPPPPPRRVEPSPPPRRADPPAPRRVVSAPEPAPRRSSSSSSSSSSRSSSSSGSTPSRSNGGGSGSRGGGIAIPVF